ncbi:hybrid sensor histidine kinase/response regulator transcription factor [Zobellia uliginosa]|uniref:hybrid sensor histidine kinase/response regulator transcription factor n=1 Tax=Zobellia uliginosa TaxID=143224 RepID=UPI00158A8421|nr:two-component regulator propeller domain-containing protein [Zobellia uliginosa]
MILYLFLISLTSFAQEQITNPSKHYTTIDGLAHNGVTSILEDSNGFLWVGTYEGLSLYNGYEFVTIKNTNTNKPLANNRVRSLFEDKNENIWIGTDEGLSVYNTTKEEFYDLTADQFPNNKDKPAIRHIMSNTSDLILCATENYGLLVYKDDYSFVASYAFPFVNKSRTGIIYDGTQLDPNNYLYSTSYGLLLFNLEKKTFKRVLSEQIYSCNSIEQVDRNTLLTTLPVGGMAVIHSNKQGSKYTFEITRVDFPQYSFKNCMVDNSNNVWLGILNDGFMRLNDASDLKNNSDYDISYFEFETNTIKSSVFYQTSLGDCWLGTFNKGLYQFRISNNPFKTYNSSMADPLGFRSNNITNMSPLDNNRIYVSSDQGGIYLFNTKSQKFEAPKIHINDEEKTNLGNVFYDSRKNLWAKIKDIGLCRIKAGSKNYEIIKTDTKSLPQYTHISSYTEDKQGNIWIIGMTGVYKIILNDKNDIINIETLNDNLFFKDKQLKYVRCIYTDPLNSNIWIGSYKKGLFKIDSEGPLKHTKIQQYQHDADDSKSLPMDFVSSIIRLPNKELWIGTEGGGICKMTEDTPNPEFICFTEEQGLSNNVIKSIQYDHDHNLWVTTNIGLNKLNTKNYTIRSFHSTDGLPFEDFWYASLFLKNGYMVFSGLNGICYFKPEEIPNNEPLPKFAFGNFKLLNKSVKAGDSINGRVLLKKPLSQTQTIELKHDENVFSLELTSLHFTTPLNHTIKYRLFPMNEEWIEVPSDQKNISYSGLPPGDYELQGMASNSINEWTDPKKINILISPPFWKTKLAYAAYILLILIVGFIINQTLLKIQKLNHKVEIEQLTINNVKEVNEAKLRFFSNISHEIKTPLTLIEGPTNTLLQEFSESPDLTDKLSLIKRQLKKIYELIEQVQDFRRADSNLLKMNYTRFDFKTFIEEITEDFRFMATNDKKGFDLVGEDSSIIVVADRDKLEKIVNNLVNNAFKYTQTNDSIKIEYRSEEKNLIVSVIDTGIGIDEVDQKHIFERFYQSHKIKSSHLSGSGIGLAFSKRLVEMHYGYIHAESEPGKGTKITFKLPIVKKQSKDTELSVEQIELPKEKEVSLSSELVENNTLDHIDVTGEFQEALVFYVEDNLEMRVYVSKLLSQYFKVQSFRNGQECINAVENQWPDIIISDIQMPEMNGLELCLKIKSNLQTSHIPVILLTALTNIKDHLRGIKDGADAYIKKPFDPKRLITRTEALLINRKRLSERYQIGMPLTKDNRNSRNDNAFLDKLYSLIEENVDNQNFDLNSLAKKLYLNRTHFFQKVKVLTNQTPYELLKSYRLQKAANLLVHEKLTVQETYQLTGFKSSSHFSKLFKEKYGVSPGKYNQEKHQHNNT